VVDAVGMESDVARKFSELVDKFMASSCHDADLADRLRAQLTVWSKNDAKLQSLFERSSLANEVKEISADLSVLAGVGLAAVDYGAHGSIPLENWKAQSLVEIEQRKNPKGQLLLMPAIAIQKLAEAVVSGGSCIAKN